MDSSRHLAQVLLSTLHCVEQNADVSPDHPDLLELKRILHKKIARLKAGDLKPAMDQVACGVGVSRVDTNSRLS